MADNVNQPQHYRNGSVECIEAIEAALGDDFRSYCIGNVLKYVWRHKHKNGEEDLRKAQVYLSWAIDGLSLEKPAATVVVPHEIAKRMQEAGISPDAMVDAYRAGPPTCATGGCDD